MKLRDNQLIINLKFYHYGKEFERFELCRNEKNYRW